MTDIALAAAELVDSVREKNPLVHHLTNYVTANDCANAVLAVGASPIMADAPEEVEEVVAMASAVVLNIGTLSAPRLQSMLLAGRCANARGIPVVLDPVGAGVSRFRNDAVSRILGEVEPAVIRGNISEISHIHCGRSSTRGVDAGHDDEALDPGSIAGELSRKLRCVVAITGRVDAIADGRRIARVDNGDALLSRITGAGCMCTSLVGAFVGADPGRAYLGAVAAVAGMAIAGEIAREAAGRTGTGAFRTAVQDALSRLDGNLLATRMKIHETAY